MTLLRGLIGSSMRSRMFRRPTHNSSHSTAFAVETMRALSSTLLLLGLIGDRRAR